VRYIVTYSTFIVLVDRNWTNTELDQLWRVPLQLLLLRVPFDCFSGVDMRRSSRLIRQVSTAEIYLSSPDVSTRQIHRRRRHKRQTRYSSVGQVEGTATGVV